MTDPRLEKALAWSRTHFFWIEVSLLTLLSAGAAYYVGRDAYRQTAVLQERARALDTVRRGADEWLTKFRGVGSPEAAIWDIGVQETAKLGVPPTDRLTLAEIITARAERAGLKNVRVTFGTPDLATAVPRAAAAPFTFNVAPYTIKVEFSGRLESTQALVGILPPAVALSSMESNRTTGTFGTKLILSVYEVVNSAPK